MSRRDACLPASVTRLAVCVLPLALAWFIVALAATGLPGWRCAPAGWCASAQSNDAFDEALEKAQLNLRRRNYDEALKWFKRAKGMKANNCAECLWGMAQAYSRLGAQKTVLETCDRLVQAAADDPRARCQGLQPERHHSFQPGNGKAGEARLQETCRSRGRFPQSAGSRSGIRPGAFQPRRHPDPAEPRSRRPSGAEGLRREL